MDKVLSMPELLRLVFEHATKKQNAVHARVCKAWLDEALDAIWHDVSLRRLLDILAPGRYDPKEGFWVFNRRLSPADWGRLHRYAPRVRRLSSIDGISSRVFHNISTTRPSLEFLPNLRRLDFTAAPSEFLPLFLTSALRSLDFSPRIGEDPAVPSVLLYVGARSPNLTSLCLRHGITASDELEEALVNMFQSLRQLTILHIPNRLLTSPVVSVLSHLPCLSALYGEEIPYSNLGPEDYAQMPTEGDCGSFPSLKTLILRLRFPDLIRWLSYRPISSLTNFHVGPMAVVTADNYSRLIQFAAASSPKLEHFSLQSLYHLEPPIIAEPLSFGHLRSVLQMSNLISLWIRHPHPLNITQSELITLLTSLPTLTTLFLNPYPENPVPHGSLSFDLTMLAAIAPYCSRLTELGLCMSSPGIPFPDVSVSSTFESLTQLHSDAFSVIRIARNGQRLAMFFYQPFSESMHVLSSDYEKGVQA
ncbi:hypothetical protein ONZ45_g3094 [Pleurotus djamor]|nr:hypothetical protein ONZ45_g3094 [Pleurotus djamor]